MPDQTAVPTYDELMKDNIQLKEQAVRTTSEAERTEERLAGERDAALARVAELENAPITKRLTLTELERVGEMAMARLYAERDRDEARARVTALKAAVAARDEQLEAAQREPIGYACRLHHSGMRELTRSGSRENAEAEAAQWRGRGYEATVVELHEPRPVTE